MCGAFSVIHPFRDLSQRFNAGYNEKGTPPRYNVRPSQPIPTILNTDPDHIVYTMWGITRHFGEKKMFFINARNDSMMKPTWKKLLREQRCLILADGFYEWQKQTQPKVPYRFELKTKEPFSFAGLWQLEKDKSGNDVVHTVIITTEPNDLVEPVHNRMPVMLTEQAERMWLNHDISEDEAIQLLIPYSASKMNSYAISTLVNSPSNDHPDILIPEENSK